MANRFETVPVPYPAQVVMRGGRKEYPVLLVAGASVRIPVAPVPELLAELKMAGQRPPQASMPYGEIPHWLGEPWRYYAHPETGDLLTDWRPSVWETNNAGGMASQRTVMGIGDVAEHLAAALSEDLTNESRAAAIGPAFNPFVDIHAWARASSTVTRPVLPEGTEFKSCRVEPGVRDEALANAARLARGFLATEDGRLLVPVRPPRWMVGNSGNRNWIMPWPGPLLAGPEQGAHWNSITVPADRPDLGEVCRKTSGPAQRYGSIRVSPGFSPEPGLPRKILLEAVGLLVVGADMSGAARDVERLDAPPQQAAAMRGLIADITLSAEEMKAWKAESDADPALLIDPLARMGHALRGFIASIGRQDNYAMANWKDPRVQARRALGTLAASLGNNETFEADRILRLVGSLTGLSLPETCLELQDPGAVETGPGDPAPSGPAPGWPPSP